MQRGLQLRIILVLIVVSLSLWLLYPPQKKINLGLDLKGGTHLILEVDTKNLPKEAEPVEAVSRALEIIRNRVDQFGVAEPLIQRQGENWIVVQLPGIKDPERAKELIGRTALLEFKLVEEDREKIKAALNGKVPDGYELLPIRRGREERELLVKKEASLTGASLVNAKVQFDAYNQPYIALEFNKEGAVKFEKVTGNNINRRLAIVLDDVIHSTPVIRDRISGGRAVIEGRFTLEEAKDLAIVLRAGALPAPVHIIEERTVGPSLGQDSIKQGILAGILGTTLVIIFMVIYYKLSGLVANFALLLNFIILVGALALLRATLTLPGIAGIILTLGMAVDANVLIFERTREELRGGKTVRAAIEAGYQKAFRTILDSNLTTLITTVFLFQFGTGPIKGFAVTLFFGIIISMFTAIVCTRVIFDYFTWTRNVTKLSI